MVGVWEVKMVVDGRREKAAAGKVSRQFFRAAREGPRAPTQSRLAVKQLKLPAEYSKLKLHDSIKVTGKRVQVNCAKSTSSLLADSCSTEEDGSWQSIPHEVIS